MNYSWGLRDPGEQQRQHLVPLGALLKGCCQGGGDVSMKETIQKAVGGPVNGRKEDKVAPRVDVSESQERGTSSGEDDIGKSPVLDGEVGRRWPRHDRRCRKKEKADVVCFATLLEKQCWRGTNCPYRHPARQPQEAAQSLCLSLVSNGCRKGERCGRYHWTFDEEEEYLTTGVLPPKATQPGIAPPARRSRYPLPLVSTSVVAPNEVASKAAEEHQVAEGQRSLPPSAKEAANRSGDASIGPYGSPSGVTENGTTRAEPNVQEKVRGPLSLVNEGPKFDSCSIPDPSRPTVLVPEEPVKRGSPNTAGVEETDGGNVMRVQLNGDSGREKLTENKKERSAPVQDQMPECKRLRMEPGSETACAVLPQQSGSTTLERELKTVQGRRDAVTLQSIYQGLQASREQITRERREHYRVLDGKVRESEERISARALAASQSLIEDRMRAQQDAFARALHDSQRVFNDRNRELEERCSRAVNDARRVFDEKLRSLEELSARVMEDEAVNQRDRECLQEERKELDLRKRSSDGISECIVCMEDWSEEVLRHQFQCGHAVACKQCCQDYIAGQTRPPYRCPMGCNLKRNKIFEPVFLG